jgi:hypothetical protein
VATWPRDVHTMILAYIPRGDTVTSAERSYGTRRATHPMPQQTPIRSTSGGCRTRRAGSLGPPVFTRTVPVPHKDTRCRLRIASPPSERVWWPISFGPTPRRAWGGPFWHSERQAGVEVGAVAPGPSEWSRGTDLDCPYGTPEHSARWTTPHSAFCILVSGVPRAGHLGYTHPRGCADVPGWSTHRISNLPARRGAHM